MKATQSQLANLRPFTSRPPGSGRKKGSVSIIKRVKEILALNDGAEELACSKAILAVFKKGNPAAIKEIMSRIDGAIVEKTEVEHSFKNLSDEELNALVAKLQGESKP